MANYCPILKENVLYIECLECQDRLCRGDKKVKDVKESPKDATVIKKHGMHRQPNEIR